MNRLAAATSPYLLQHKDNPVHWWEWGPEAFAEAKRLGKPVLLSVGYAACHWCHVMAHESFENDSIAALMNELFICIKVDREERPDVDQIYMAALHSLGEQGGWPLTMFLSDEREPFWGGTYFPPEPRYGRPGFPQILREIARLYRDERDRINRNITAIADALRQNLSVPAQSSQTVTASDLAALLVRATDQTYGGLQGAPKFPNAPLLSILMREGLRDPASPAWRAFTVTLDGIIAGGIHDHVGGGFARYAVDETWLVPHFEKMLYDNAQLLELCAEAYAETQSPHYRFAAEGIVAWLEREMTLDGGGFASSLDADSEGEEGRFYVWSHAELSHHLSAAELNLLSDSYGLTPQGNWEGHTILNRIGQKPLTEEDAAALAPLRAKLLALRSHRIRPGLDDKVLADWNGMMITALARASRIFNRPDWLAMAERAFHFISDHFERDNRLGHSWREGRLLFPGFASDHAFMALAAISLAEAGSTKPDLLTKAASWVDQALALFKTPDGILALASQEGDLPIPATSMRDDAIANANGVMIEALIRIHALLGRPQDHASASQLLDHCLPAAQSAPLGHASIISGLTLMTRTPTLSINGTKPETMLALCRALSPMTTILAGPIGTKPSLIDEARWREAGDGAVFLCVGAHCSLPIKDSAAIHAAWRAALQ